MSLINLTCQTPTRFVRVAYLSLQPGGDVSFGLQDRTFISPRFKVRKFVWSMYNRVTAEYEIGSDANALEQVKNPHFTFHAPHLFHLKSNKDRVRKDDQLFAGICPVDIVIQQQGRMPWLRATTKPLRDYRSAGMRWTSVPTNDMPFNAHSEDISVKIELDFIKLSDVGVNDGISTRSYAAGNVGVEMSASMTNPTSATLSWFHEH